MSKYMQLRQIDAEEFKKKWKNSELTVLKSDQIPVDQNLIKHVGDFKKYFGELVELKSQKRNEQNSKTRVTKLGGIFGLHIPYVDYLLKLNILSSGELVFQVAVERKNYDFACYLLQTLVFIFKQ